MADQFDILYYGENHSIIHYSRRHLTVVAGATEPSYADMTESSSDDTTYTISYTIYDTLGNELDMSQFSYTYSIDGDGETQDITTSSGEFTVDRHDSDYTITMYYYDGTENHSLGEITVPSSYAAEPSYADMYETDSDFNTTTISYTIYDTDGNELNMDTMPYIYIANGDEEIQVITTSSGEFTVPKSDEEYTITMYYNNGNENIELGSITIPAIVNPSYAELTENYSDYKTYNVDYTIYDTESNEINIDQYPYSFYISSDDYTQDITSSSGNFVTYKQDTDRTVIMYYNDTNNDVHELGSITIPALDGPYIYDYSYEDSVNAYIDLSPDNDYSIIVGYDTGEEHDPKYEPENIPKEKYDVIPANTILVQVKNSYAGRKYIMTKNNLDEVYLKEGTTDQFYVTKNNTDWSKLFAGDTLLLAVLQVGDLSAISSMNGMFENSGITKIIGNDWNTRNVRTMANMFNDCESFNTLNVSKFDTSVVTDMSSMFKYCYSLSSIDVSGWNTSHVNDLSYTFSSCRSLTTLNVSNWMTSNVKNMANTFSGCQSLKQLDVSNWTTSNVKNMANTFSGCQSLTTLDVHKWNTARTTNISGMFNGCRKIEALDVSHWNTSNVTDMSYTFFNCHSLAELDVSNWDTSNVTDMTHLFCNCSTLPTLNVSRWNTINVTKMSNIFYDCYELSNLDVSSWVTANVTDMHGMFCSCKKLSTLTVSHWDTSNVTDMEAMFCGCNSLAGLSVSNWSTSKVTNMEDMFHSCTKISELNVSNWDTLNVTNMNGLFRECTSLTTLDVSKWNTSKVTSMYSMFYHCTKLKTIDVSNWNMETVTDIKYMFSGCDIVKTLDVSNWNTSHIKWIDYAFEHCSSLIELDVSNWDTSNVVTMEGVFSNCYVLPTIDVSNWDTNKVTKTAYIFNNCHSVSTLDVSNWNMSIISNMSYMFYNCNALTNLDVSKWNPRNALDVSYMFYYCTSLTTIDVSKWNPHSLQKTMWMFGYCTKLREVPNIQNWNISELYDASYMFFSCRSAAHGVLSAYNKLSTESNPRYHLATFHDCGIDSGTGVAELNQIPDGWK